MASSRKMRVRPLAFKEAGYLWNIQRVPRTLSDGTPHPGRRCGIFVVHGIGQQHWTETAAQLRAGFEDAFEEIALWQKENPDKAGSAPELTLPPPFVFEGFWADYDDLPANFPRDWSKFNEREQTFFGNLWKQRVVSGGETLLWMLRKQIGLLKPRVVWEVGPLTWLLYWPLQIVASAALLWAWLRHRELITGFLNDVRLYVEPRGVVERAIAQRIDERVVDQFLRMIGRDREFRELPATKLIEAGGERLVFDRVIWVAHSLGTVISYNALSALFHKADEVMRQGDDEQQTGVRRFRSALRRFVTMGSPLDKVAFLFGETALHPWPEQSRSDLLPETGETSSDGLSSRLEWWVNFYHVLDPVSGALGNPSLFGKQPPANFHLRSGLVPGLAHVAYWRDLSTLRFILGRTYGAALLRDMEYRAWPPWKLRLLAVLGHVAWMAILVAMAWLVIRLGPVVVRTIVTNALGSITG